MPSEGGAGREGMRQDKWVWVGELESLQQELRHNTALGCLVPCPEGLGQVDNGLACESPIKKVHTVWALDGLACI